MPIFKPPKTGGAPDTPSTGTGTGTSSSGGIGGTLGDEPPPYRPNDEPDCVETSSCSDSNGKGDKEPPEIPDLGSSNDDSSSSSSSSNQPTHIGAGPAWNSTDSNDYSNPTAESSSQSPSTSNAALPIWAIALIIVASVMGLVFLVSLWVFCARERQKRYGRNRSPSYRRALGRALAAATGAFIPIWIINKCRSKPRERGDDYYAKLEAHLNYEDSQTTTATAYVSPVKVQRAPSIVSSLSSHSASQGRYERLQPSPMSERASIASSLLQRPPEAQVRDHDAGGDAERDMHATDSGRETAAGRMSSGDGRGNGS